MHGRQPDRPADHAVAECQTSENQGMPPRSKNSNFPDRQLPRQHGRKPGPGRPQCLNRCCRSPHGHAETTKPPGFLGYAAAAVQNPEDLVSGGRGIGGGTGFATQGWGSADFGLEGLRRRGAAKAS